MNDKFTLGLIQMRCEAERRANLDREYVEKWVAVLELDDQWAAALAGAG